MEGGLTSAPAHGRIEAMDNLRFHVRYQALIRQDVAPPLLCSCGANLYIHVHWKTDEVDYECWACDRTVVLGLSTLKQMDAYIKEHDGASRLQRN